MIFVQHSMKMDLRRVILKGIRKLKVVEDVVDAAPHPSVALIQGW
jgi:hypothetical protein